MVEHPLRALDHFLHDPVQTLHTSITPIEQVLDGGTPHECMGNELRTSDVACARKEEVLLQAES